MNKFAKLFFFSSFIFNLSSQASAENIAKKVAQSLKHELTNISRRLEENRRVYHKNSYYYENDTTVFYLKSVTLRIKPFVEFKIPGILKIKMMPRFDFRWQRKPPKGWVDYSPKN